MTPVHHGAALPSPDGERRAVGMSGGIRTPEEEVLSREDPSARRHEWSRDSTGPEVPGPDAGAVVLTERLRLAPVAEADEAELFALHADPRAFVGDSTDPLTDPAQMAWVLARWRESWARHGSGHRTVRARVGADLPVGLLGVVGLVPLAGDAGPVGDGDPASADGPASDREADAGATTGPPAELVLSAYWRLHPDVTGHGIATEAMRAVLEALPTTARRAAPAVPEVPAPPDSATVPDVPARPEIVAITARGNTASLALASRLGFRPAPPERPVPGGRADDVLLLLDPSTEA